MKWISNTYNPQAKDWETSIIRMAGEAEHEAIKRMEEWLKDKIIGEPVAPNNSAVTFEKLKKSNFVGVYSK